MGNVDWVLTAQPAAMALALAEAGHARVRRQLAPGVALCADVQRPTRPIFLRHMCPAAVEVPLAGTAADLGALSEAFGQMLPGLSPAAGSFSVQTRIIEGYRPDYGPFDVNTPLAAAAQQAGFTLDVRHPAQVVSVTLAEGMGWLGVSSAQDNLSDWAGGARRFKQEVGQISRAEFKLLEALEVFGLRPADGERALDLGAAPGGWTRVLRRRGLYVTAVDPAALDARLTRDKRVTHARMTTQAYLRGQTGVFDWIVNDMRMDSAESATLMVEASDRLRADGGAILTLKLPEDVAEWMPRMEAAENVLGEAYAVEAVRQLFHNRNEVTAYLRKR